mmetsp:Transcript_41383/g.103048  ORF Transcript_41383/g.103048 Transcript_41383/m.103048 type:complete len:234 (-) Transcript_41383:70-771(-)
MQSAEAGQPRATRSARRPPAPRMHTPRARNRNRVSLSLIQYSLESNAMRCRSDAHCAGKRHMCARAPTSTTAATAPRADSGQRRVVAPSADGGHRRTRVRGGRSQHGIQLQHRMRGSARRSSRQTVPLEKCASVRNRLGLAGGRAMRRECSAGELTARCVRMSDVQPRVCLLLPCATDMPYTAQHLSRCDRDGAFCRPVPLVTGLPLGGHRRGACPSPMRHRHDGNSGSDARS